MKKASFWFDLDVVPIPGSQRELRSFERPWGNLKRSKITKALVVRGPHEVGGAEAGPKRQ